MEKSKSCTQCKQIKPLSDYYKNSSVKSGLYSWCKSCHNSYCKTKNTNCYRKRKEYFHNRYIQSDKYAQSQINRAQRASEAVSKHIINSDVWYYKHRENIEGYLNRFFKSKVPRFRGLGEYMLNIWNTYNGDPMKIHQFYVDRAKNAIRKPYNPNALCWYRDGIYCRWEQLHYAREWHQAELNIKRHPKLQSKYGHLFAKT